MSVVERDYISRLQTLLVFSILNGTAKTKLAILAFLYCGQIVKNSNETRLDYVMVNWTDDLNQMNKSSWYLFSLCWSDIFSVQLSAITSPSDKKQKSPFVYQVTPLYQHFQISSGIAIENHLCGFYYPSGTIHMGHNSSYSLFVTLHTFTSSAISLTTSDNRKLKKLRWDFTSAFASWREIQHH